MMTGWQTREMDIMVEFVRESPSSYPRTDLFKRREAREAIPTAPMCARLHVRKIHTEHRQVSNMTENGNSLGRDVVVLDGDTGGSEEASKKKNFLVGPMSQAHRQAVSSIWKLLESGRAGGQASR